MSIRLYPILATLIAFVCGISAFADGSFTGASYSATCRFPYPLDTYQGCNEFTDAGQEAANCALDQATLDCKNDYNSDCITVGTTYQEIVSTEFIGYKACEATVLVHGYREQN